MSMQVGGDSAEGEVMVEVLAGDKEALHGDRVGEDSACLGGHDVAAPEPAPLAFQLDAQRGARATVAGTEDRGDLDGAHVRFEIELRLARRAAAGQQATCEQRRVEEVADGEEESGHGDEEQDDGH